MNFTIILQVYSQFYRKIIIFAFIHTLNITIYGQQTIKSD